MHQNNIFFKKIIFDISTSKQSKNTKKIISSKKNQILDKQRFGCNAKHVLINYNLFVAKKQTNKRTNNISIFHILKNVTGLKAEKVQIQPPLRNAVLLKRKKGTRCSIAQHETWIQFITTNMTLTLPNWDIATIRVRDWFLYSLVSLLMPYSEILIFRNLFSAN